MVLVSNVIVQVAVRRHNHHRVQTGILKQMWIVTLAIIQTVGETRERSITAPIPLVEAPISINAENIPGTTSTAELAVQQSPV
jgi:hypothetical protein